MDIDVKVSTVTKSTSTITLSRDDIIVMLIDRGIDVAHHARVEFRVPIGGDWSGTNVEVDTENPIIVTWETVTHD